MAHEIESMMYLNATPWHGLGTRVTKAPSVDEAIKLAGLDWTVRTEPVYLADGTTVPAKAIIRDTDNKVLGVGGPKYAPLQNVEAFRWFQPFVESGMVELDTAGSLRGGQRVWVLGKIVADPIEVVPGDAVERYLTISNGHDGKMAIRVGFTPIRIVCANTLALAHEDKRSKLLRVMHVGKPADTLDDIRKAVDVANNAFIATAEVYKSLAGRPIHRGDLEKYVKAVFKVDSKVEKLVGAEEMTDEVRDQIEAEINHGARIYETVSELFDGDGLGSDLKGVAGTWWGAFNSITEYLTHHRGKDDMNRLENLWFGQGPAVTRKALKLAQELSLAA